jgi:hypothetical protein
MKTRAFPPDGHCGSFVQQTARPTADKPTLDGADLGNGKARGCRNDEDQSDREM